MEGLIFRTALRECCNRGKFGLRDRRMIVRMLDDNPEALELAAASLADQMDPEPVPPGPRPTPILDKLGQWLKWVIENQDKVISFIQAIVAIFVGIFV